MVIELMGRAGVGQERLYFDVERIGNISSASMPTALHDAVRDGVVSAPVRVFAPGFGAGAVGGYSVMRFDPAIVAPQDAGIADWHPALVPGSGLGHDEHTSDQVRIGFAE